MSGDRSVGEVLERWKPSATKSGLLFMGGLFWAFAGALLVLRGLGLFSVPVRQAPLFVSLALVGAVLFYKLMFERVSFRYISRILALQEQRPCLFSFLNLRGYLTMVLMIGLGLSLRWSGLLPGDDLGTLYLAIGLPLAASSRHFFRQGLLTRR
ncbi:MAG TPA: hypothetical protein VF775_03485 [Geobacteraceae bacterium]